MNTRTIIMLSAPRCGANAICEVFKKHPDAYALFESHFWNLAADAIEGDTSRFVKRISRNFPFLDISPVITEETVFTLWSVIHKKIGPVIVDKTSFYLGNRKALNLIRKYRNAGNDVRLFALIRDPRDAITSQYELWGSAILNAFVKKTEEQWLNRYRHLEEIQNEFGSVPVFRYEEVSQSPRYYIPKILHYCGLKELVHTYDHIKPAHTGRYASSLNLNVRRWKISYALKRYLVKYGYNKRKEKLFSSVLSFLLMLPGNIGREVISAIKRRRRIRRKKRLGLL